MLRLRWQVGFTVVAMLFIGLETAEAQERPILRLFRKDPARNSTPIVVSHQIVQPAPEGAIPHAKIVQPLPEGAVPYASGQPIPLGAMPDASARDPRFPKLHSCFNQHGIGCYSHHNLIRSGTFHSTATFIFGSSHTFFGESCLPYPPKERHSFGTGSYGGCR